MRQGSNRTRNTRAAPPLSVYGDEDEDDLEEILDDEDDIDDDIEYED